MPHRENITGVILAGGKSARMGQNKALMRLGEQRLIDRVVGVVGAVCRDLLMITNTPEVYADLGIRMEGDVMADTGSLGGIYSALYYAATPYCLVVACDMPFLNAAVLHYLIEQAPGYDVVIPEVHDEYQPLHALYHQTCRTPILQRLQARRLKITGFFPDVRVRTVAASELQPLDPGLQAFDNLNTPEEFQLAVQRLRSALSG